MFSMFQSYRLKIWYVKKKYFDFLITANILKLVSTETSNQWASKHRKLIRFTSIERKQYSITTKNIFAFVLKNAVLIIPKIS